MLIALTKIIKTASRNCRYQNLFSGLDVFIGTIYVYAEYLKKFTAQENTFSIKDFFIFCAVFMRGY